MALLNGDCLNKFNPKKLLNAKWTAVSPEHKERHFIVTKLLEDEEGVVASLILEAVINHKEYKLFPSQLKDQSIWLQGWH